MNGVCRPSKPSPHRYHQRTSSSCECSTPLSSCLGFPVCISCSPSASYISCKLDLPSSSCLLSLASISYLLCSASISAFCCRNGCGSWVGKVFACVTALCFFWPQLRLHFCVAPPKKYPKDGESYCNWNAETKTNFGSSVKPGGNKSCGWRWQT